MAGQDSLGLPQLQAHQSGFRTSQWKVSNKRNACSTCQCHVGDGCTYQVEAMAAVDRKGTGNQSNSRITLTPDEEKQGSHQLGVSSCFNMKQCGNIHLVTFQARCLFNVLRPGNFIHDVLSIVHVTLLSTVSSAPTATHGQG
jgi:hypothetical protein